MVSDLKDAGFRSGQLPCIPEGLMHHWLRGLFDGDGSVYIDKTNKTYVSIVFSTKEFATSVLDYIVSQIGFSSGMKIYKKQWPSAGILE